MVRITLQENWKLFCFCFFFLQNCKKPTRFTFLPRTNRSYISCCFHAPAVINNIIMFGWYRQTPRKGTGGGPSIFPWHWYTTIQTEMCLGMFFPHFLCLPHLLILLSCQHKSKAQAEFKNASCQLYTIQMHTQCIC